MSGAGGTSGALDVSQAVLALRADSLVGGEVRGRLTHLSSARLVLEDAEMSLECRCTPTLQQTGSAVPGDLVVAQISSVEAGVVHVGALASVAAGKLTAPSAPGEHARRLGQRMRARAAAQRFVRSYFDAAGFLEVDTPVRVPAPGLDLHVDALPAHEGWLITSPEHHMKRLLVAGLTRIYQIARASRAEELGALHQPEFLLLEWYRAYAGMAEVMADTEALVVGVVQALRDPELQLARVPYRGATYDLTRPFARISVRDAYRRFAGVEDVVELARSDEDRYFELMVDRVEPGLTALGRPVFLHGYPLSQASLARPDPLDPETAERFELYLAGVELCNGFGELTDAAEQRRRYVAAIEDRRARQMPVYPLDEPFLAALEEGMPPAGGNALGLDRLLMLALDEASLDAVVPFPVPRPE
ncbi:MAG: EF-P lysine aminoacylase EpmA [Polyangiaceae bacterium]